MNDREKIKKMLEEANGKVTIKVNRARNAKRERKHAEMFRRIREKMKKSTYLMDILAIMTFFAAMVISAIGIFYPKIPQVIVWALLWFGLIINWQAEIIRKNIERNKNVLMDVWLHRVKYSLDDLRDELYQENPCNETMLKDCEEALGKIHECYKELGQC